MNSLRERAQAALETQRRELAEESRRQEEESRRQQEQLYQVQAQESSKRLRRYLEEILGETPAKIHIMTGPGNSPIATYLQGDLVFATYYGELCVTRQRPDEQPLPHRRNWRKIRCLADLGTFLEEG